MRFNSKFAVASVVSVCALAANSAFAALPPSVATSMGDATTSAAELGGYALIAIIAAVGFKYARRAL